MGKGRKREQESFVFKNKTNKSACNSGANAQNPEPADNCCIFRNWYSKQQKTDGGLPYVNLAVGGTIITPVELFTVEKGRKQEKIAQFTIYIYEFLLTFLLYGIC